MLPFAGLWPRIDPEAWVAPGVTVIGDVEIGPGSSVWFGSVVRGDLHSVRIGARTNLQDLCVVHVTRHRFSTQLGDEVTVGHRAVVHGCRIGDGALIGIGAIVLDGAEVGEEALVGAGSVVTPGTKIPPRALALGTPARVVRLLSPGEREEQRVRAHHYVELARAHRDGAAL
ncbi:MAG TPA: gamma carbonic anhydrase family protein [Deltaproteobacteria bacterium]|nr:gamma carbonic anhydrase family protein [Deltaproteobacteria bacterium]